jgi:hypothetical protein
MTTVRFLTIGQVAEELAISHAQIYTLPPRRDLGGFTIGGRGQWRVELSKGREVPRADLRRDRRSARHARRRADGGED